MEIDHDRVALLSERTVSELALHRSEGIVERVHEEASHGIDDEDPGSVARLTQKRASSRRASRIVGRPNETRLTLDEDQGLALIEGVIAEGDHIGPCSKELVTNGFGDAEA